MSGVLTPSGRHPSRRSSGFAANLEAIASDVRSGRYAQLQAATLAARLAAAAGTPQSGLCAIDRLVLWNIDLTLIDVGRVARDAYADAFRRVTGRSLAALPQLAGRSDTEIFFESLFLNDVPTGLDETADT